MRVLIVFDSYFGNTEKVARAIGDALSAGNRVEVSRVSDVKPEQLAGVQLLIVGSPTRAFRPSPAISRFLKSIPAHGLKDVKVAAFDTRISPADTGSRLLQFMVKLFGYADKPIENRLRKKGGEPALSPEGFFVKGSEGPLKDGELERAAAWACTALGAPNPEQKHQGTRMSAEARMTRLE